jgi:glyoxylase-like metal-dependent hydrolase (beta-lactamase superfamily II)
MHVHHLSCGSIRAHGVELANHCLLVETARALVLIDTGFGMRDVLVPHGRLSPWYLKLMRPRLRTELTAVRQVRRLGFDPRDVQHIILSHLDCDRAGGLDDFPEATVHVSRDEVTSAFARTTWLDRQRYRPQQWTSRARWRTYLSRGETFSGLHGVHALLGLPPEILFVPLPGHTLGHSGVAIRTQTSWLLYAGDAYMFHGELGAAPACPSGLRVLQWILEKDRRARLRTQAQLRALARASSDISVFCAHDRYELELLAPSPAPPKPAARPAPFAAAA